MATIRFPVPANMAVILVLAATVFPKDGLAVPMQIELLDASYTTTVSAESFGPLASETSRTLISPTPIQDSLYEKITIDSLTHTGMAAAEASTFQVMASGSTGALDANGNPRRSNYWSTLASARSEIVFSPLSDGLAGLTINLRRDFDFGFTDGHASLYDITSSVEVFNYDWPQFGSGNIPWVDNKTASVIIDTAFFNDHTYRLSMGAGMSSNGDAELANINLSGLQLVSPAPEPSTYALMLAGLGVLGWVARSRREGARKLALSLSRTREASEPKLAHRFF